MSDLNYNVHVGVEGADAVQTLRDDVADLDEKVDDLGDGGTATVAVDATGVTETAEGLESISDSDAAGTLDTVGSSAGQMDAPVQSAAVGVKNLVAGLLAIGALDFLVEKVMGAIAEHAAEIAAQKAFDASQVTEFVAALQDADSAAGALRDTFSVTRDIIGGVQGEDFNLTPFLAQANVTATEFFELIRSDDGLDTLRQKFDDAGVSGALLGGVMTASEDIANNMTDAQLEDAAATEVWGESQAQATAETDARNAAQEALQQQMEEAAVGAQEFSDAISSVDWQQAEIEGATTAMSSFTTGLFAAGNEVQARESAFDALKASVDGYAFTMNAGTDAGRAQQDALEGVARVLDTDLAQAYDDANGSQDAFVAAATKLGDETLARLQTDLNLTDEQVDGLRNTLGLTAADYDARFNLSGAEEARIQLQLLTGAIQGLPPDVEFRVNALIAEGDLVGARDEVAAFYSDPANAATITTTVDPSGAEDGIAEVTDADHPTTITADADTVTAASDLLDTALEPRTATIVARAHVAGAAIDLDAAAEPRTAPITAVLVAYPSADEIRRLIGTVTIDVVARTKRIFGSRS